MDFPISGTHLQPLYLIGTGLVVGLLGGFFGVGGSFLAGPALFAMRLPMNFVVGTDLAHIVGKSIVAFRKHQKLGHVDLKLGLLMVGGTVAGVEVGAQAVQYLKRHAHANQVLAVTFIAVLLGVSAFIGWESWQSLKRNGKKMSRKTQNGGQGGAASKGDFSVMAPVARRLQRIQIPPMVSLPHSGIRRVSLWIILGVGFTGGVFSGFLGGGAGYFRMPALVYLLGIPTHLAVGTDLFEVVISAGYGTVSHALKGNVDILIALVMHTGAAIGAQIGSLMTQYFQGPRIRLAFIPLPLAGAALMIYTLASGR